MTGPRIKAALRMDGRWYHQATCFPDHALFDSRDPADIAEAKRICNTLCPVKAECLEDALRHESEPGESRHGVRGGLTEDERAALPKRRPALKPINHGTYGGYMAHKRRGEDPCLPCRDAYRDYQRQKRAKDADRKRRERAAAKETA